jgi:hypothetical protein
MTAAATTLPDPVAVDGVVFNDPVARTLHVRLPDSANGYTRLLFRQGWQALRQAEESGWRNAVPDVWAHTAEQRLIAHGLPGEDGTLRFHFPAKPGSAYSELVSKPGLTAIISVDRQTHHILAVRFLQRP